MGNSQYLTKSERIRNRFLDIYLCAYTVIWCYTIITFNPEARDTFGFYLLCAETFFNLYCTVLVFALRFNTVQPMLPYYICIISLMSFPSLVMSYHLQTYETYWQYLVSMTAIFIIFPNQKAIFWCGGLILFQIIPSCVFGEFVLPHFLHDISNLQQSALVLCFGNNFVIDILFVFSILFIVVIYIIMFREAEHKEMVEKISQEILNRENQKSTNERGCTLFENIEKYVEENEPYLDPNFSLNQLSVAVGSNAAYVSAAIKHCKDIGFNLFINTYRVNRVKELLDKDKDRKYTLQHIYSLSGFNSQATFNRTFKQVTGITPSEYLSKI